MTQQDFGRDTRQARADVVELIPALRAFARTFYRDPDAADDLVQDTLTKAIGKIHQFEPGTRLKSWLFTIMRNTFYNRLVVEKREAPGSADCVSSLPVHAASQGWSMAAKETEMALARLPQKQREVLVLICLNGASYKEAAEICDCDIGTIKSRLNRSRANLLAELGEVTAAALFR
jgi:RNA polymerase sigma factor (sigma-70 family)